jgi:hypothetical protein
MTRSCGGTGVVVEPPGEVARGVVSQARGEVAIGARDAGRGFDQPFAVRVLADREEQLPHGAFESREVHPSPRHGEVARRGAAFAAGDSGDHRSLRRCKAKSFKSFKR